MLKKIMLYLMVLIMVVRFAALTFLVSTNRESLPVLVYASSGLMILTGLVLLCKAIIKTVNRRELSVFYVVLFLSVLFNLIYMKIFSRAELGMIDLTVIGTILDLVASVTLVVLSFREDRYVRIRMKSEIMK